MAIFGNKIKYNCGGVGKHLNGCDGWCTQSEQTQHFEGAHHSHEVKMTPDQYKDFLDRGGKGTPRRVSGGFMVHVTKKPRK